MKILVSGYYGHGNNGDNAMLMSIIEDIKSVCENADITIISGTPKETKEAFGVKTVHKYNFIAIILAIFGCDVLILGGGTLIQDVTSTKSLHYYLGIIRCAKILKKKVMLYANGFNSMTSFKNIENTRDVLNKVDVITLRDEKSFKELENIGVNMPEIKITADPAFLIAPDDQGGEILAHYGIAENKPLLGIAVHKSKNNPKDFEEKIASFCDYAAEKYGLFPVFLPMEKRSDYSLCASIKNKMRSRSVVIGTNYELPSVLSVMKQMHICVGTGIYSHIYSAISNVPMIGIYDSKDWGLWEYMHGDEYLVNIEEFSENNLKEHLDNISADYDSIKSSLKFNVRILRGKAKENREFIEKLIFGTKSNNEVNQKFR